MQKRQRFFTVIFSIILVFVLLFSSIVNLIIDLQWFDDLGYQDVFLVKILAYLWMGLPLWLVSSVLFSGYFLWVQKQYFKLVHIIVDVKNSATGQYKKTAIAAGVGLSFFLTFMTVSAIWFDVLNYINATSFGKLDPLFAKDISFYVFQLPLYNKLIGIGVFYVVILAGATVLINIILMSVRPPTDMDFSDFQNVRTIGDLSSLTRKGIMQSVVIKLGVFGLMIFMLLIAYFWLARYNLVFSPSGVAFGASYTDINVTLPSIYVQIGAAVIGSVAFLYGLVKKHYRWMLTGPVLLISVSFLFGLGGVVVQTFIVEPDEVSKERQYLEYNIAYTRAAYGIEEIDVLPYPISQTLSEEDLEKNREVIDNIRINDYRPLRQTYNQIQGIRLYYRFNDIDIDRYLLDGQLTQVFLSAREIDSNRLQVQTWINRHIKFTHGYGVALSRVNAVASDGLPELAIKNIPPEFSTDLVITRPEIYFGELTHDYIIVKTTEMEFDYPLGSDNAEVIYESDNGIPMNLWNRLLFSVYHRDFRILVSNVITPDSRMLMRRQVLDRASAIAPYLIFDKDPYIVISPESGKLYWIIDAYTYSNAYPYSQPHGNTSMNYIRNSVKTVVDAYTGEINLYVMEEKDPLIKTYSGIYPTLYKTKEEFPQDLIANIRYPKTLFQIQAEAYRKYHVTNPGVFYNGEDVWDIATEIYMDSSEMQPVMPDYALYKLPGEESVEFLLTVPFTPRDKPNMSSLFIARSDGEGYGKMFLYEFPKDRTVLGPAMIESKIDQDSIISPQLSLWNQKGSTVLRGNILILPINGNLLYIEPVYIQADNPDALPEMKQVIVSYGERLVMADTLDRALASLFGASYSREDLVDDLVDGLPIDAIENLLDEAIRQFNSTQSELNSLKQILDDLQRALDEKRIQP